MPPKKLAKQHQEDSFSPWKWHWKRIQPDLLISRFRVRFPFLCLCPRRWASHIPKTALIRRKRGVIPNVDQNTLASIYIVLLSQLLHSNFHPIPRKHNIFLLHFRASILADFLDDAVRNVRNNGENDNRDQENEERNEWLHFARNCSTNAIRETLSYSEIDKGVMLNFGEVCGLDWEICFQKVVRNVQMDKEASRQYPDRKSVV